MVKSIGIIKESKTDQKGREIENRVVLIPEQLKELANRCRGIDLFVEENAGLKIDCSNADYEAAGATICSHAEILSKEMIVGVKETRSEDFASLRDNLFLSFQHFAQSRERTMQALKTPATFITWETMEDVINGLSFFPCLAPMSEAASKIIARHADEYALLVKKIITSGLPETGLHGVRVAILGGGAAGRTAAEEFSERGCEVTLLEKNPSRKNELTEYFHCNEVRYPKVSVLESTPQNLRAAVRGSLFLVSAMYTAGRKPDKIVTIDLLKTMLPGGCVYTIDIDQGGGVEGVSETSPLEPFELPAIEGTEIKYFSPPNLPSLGARTTSEALGKVILPLIIEIANKGITKAAEENPLIASGINIRQGKIIHPGLAAVFPGIDRGTKLVL